MGIQLNVFDPELSSMSMAKDHPGKYPGIVVRVAGYCSYFDDLSDSEKKELSTGRESRFLKSVNAGQDICRL